MTGRYRDRSWPWTESFSDEELEQADAFWEEWVGESRRRRRRGTRTAGTTTGTSTTTHPCLSATRNADFANNLAPTTVMPRPEICKLLVTTRGGAIPGAPVSGGGGSGGGGGGSGGGTGQDPNVDLGGGGAGAGGLRPGQARPDAVEFLDPVGTGFFIAPNRIVTCAHVVLDAVSVVVIPGKMGAAVSGTTEPFGRFTVGAGHIVIAPGALTAITTPTAPRDQFFAHDLAVIRNFSMSLPSTISWVPGGVYKLAGTPTPQACVGTSGYSSVTVDGNFQHIDRGYVGTPTALVNFNLKTEKGASGSPIWTVPPMPGSSSGPTPRQVVGVVAMGNTPLHTGSPPLTPSHITFLKTA